MDTEVYQSEARSNLRGDVSGFTEAPKYIDMHQVALPKPITTQNPKQLESSFGGGVVCVQAST